MTIREKYKIPEHITSKVARKIFEKALVDYRSTKIDSSELSQLACILNANFLEHLNHDPYLKRTLDAAMELDYCEHNPTVPVGYHPKEALAEYYRMRLEAKPKQVQIRATKGSLQDIIQGINQIVIDYIECKDGIGKVAERMTPYDAIEVLDLLTETGNGVLVIIIQKAREIGWETAQYGYNPKDPGSVQSVLQRYYDEIKSGKKPVETSIRYSVGRIDPNTAKPINKDCNG